jgi:MFS family permease
MSTKTRSIALIIFCQVACMTLWFSASAVVPGLIASGLVSGTRASLLTGAVQLGFVAGTLCSAFFGLPDRLDPRRLFAAAALLGGLTNALILVTGFDHPLTIVLRFITGVTLAGVYPVGMKLAAGWASRNLGLMIGALVGALTLGSALPHLFRAMSELDWRTVIAASSLCALTGAVLINFCALGPAHAKAMGFRPAQALRLLRRPSVLLVNGGYLGHMWELYAMWAWIGSFLTWGLSVPGSNTVAVNPALMTFIVVASGAIGCLGAGLLADRFGRTTITISAMLASGLCAAFIGTVASFGAGWLMAVAVIWGITIVADSAQFSAAMTELSEPALAGTMLTLQTSMGFLLTFVAIQGMPLAIEWLTWKYAFTVLAIGPFLGALSMWRLRSLPDALKLAGGKR